jgi:hypothetical protein
LRLETEDEAGSWRRGAGAALTRLETCGWRLEAESWRRCVVAALMRLETGGWKLETGRCCPIEAEDWV